MVDRKPAVGRDALRRFACHVGIPAVDRHTGTLYGEQLRHRQPDAARTADDHRAAAGQCFANCSSPVFRIVGG